MTVFKEFENEVIPTDTEYKWTDKRIKKSRLTPSWKDLQEKRIAAPGILQRLLNDLKEEPFLILTGHKETGKTWLSYMAAYNLHNQQKSDVYYVQVGDDFEADFAWKKINKRGIRSPGQNTRYVIVDDCHINPEESEDFLQTILDKGEQNLRFLFVMRKTGKFILEDVEEVDIFYKEGTRRDNIIRLSADYGHKEHIKNIIKKFIEVEGVDYRPTESELDKVAKKWGGNLFWVHLRLVSWKPHEDQKLFKVTNAQVYDHVWSRRGEIKLCVPERRDVLSYLAVFSQFEQLKVYELVSFLEDHKKMLNKLIAEGIVRIESRGKYDYLSLPESFAELILSTMVQKDRSCRERIDEQIQVFQNYLKGKLPPNWPLVFYRLYSARGTENNELAKKILDSLWHDSDIVQMVKEHIKDVMEPGTAVSVPVEIVKSFEWVERENSRRDGERIKEIVSSYWRKRMKSSTAEALKGSIKHVAPYLHLRDFFRDFSQLDFKRIINRSNLNQVRRLLYGLFEENWDLPSVAERVLKALPQADIARLISEKGDSLFKVSGLIVSIRRVDRSACERFIEKLSEVKLDDLFLRENPKAEERGYTKANVVNHFLTKRTRLAPEARKKIVSNISNETWKRLIIPASLENGTWLLWNIYINDPSKAKNLVKIDIVKSLLQKCPEGGEQDFYFPLFGIFHLCDFPICSVPHPAMNLAEIRKLLNKFKGGKPYDEEPYPESTLLVLSMVALKVGLPSEEFEEIKKILDEQLIKFIQTPPDPQVREVLGDLVKYIKQ